jgi:hypothetical protein
MITDFYLDPSYININIVKRIGIDKDINSIIVGINDNLLSVTIHLENFYEKTITPLKMELAGLLLARSIDKQSIINSIITCIHSNIDLIKSSQPQQNKDKGEEKESNNKSNEKDNVNNAQLLVNLASEKHNTELYFKNQYGEAYAAVRLGRDNHLEIMSLESRKYKHYLARLFRENTGGQIVGKDAINNAINTLSANAVFDGETIPLHLRIAWGNTKNRSTNPGCIYYDMTDDARRIVEISKDGKRMINGNDANAPILFRRHNQTAQVEPDSDYEPDIFDQFLNLTNVKKKHQQLIKVYVVSLLIPEIAHVILNIHGPKGAAKSFLLMLIKILIDPSKPILLTLPKKTEEFIQQVYHNHLSFYDNVKYISQDLSNEICKAITGIGSTKRKLFTDSEDVIYEYKHCLSLNGINIALTESDALDRSLMIELEEIRDEDRKKEEDLLAEFERIRPKVFAYILDVLLKAMQIKTTLHLPMLTRMADFTEWGEAISRAMGYDKMTFIRAFNENRGEQNVVAIEESIVGSLLVKFWNDYIIQNNKESSTLVTSPGNLFNQLVAFAENNDININHMHFPKIPSVLVKKLNIIKPNLKEAYGIIVKVDRNSNNTSIITIYDTRSSFTKSNPSLNQNYSFQVLQKQILR